MTLIIKLLQYPERYLRAHAQGNLFDLEAFRMSNSTKLAFLTQATEAYTPYQGTGSYDDLVRTKMESLVREAYPWLGDFTLEVVNSDKDKSYACATGTLRGFSSGYAVEFPVFYLEGDIMDIPTFVLPDRDLMLPFDESFYKVITSTLNNSDDLGLVREREDLSDALVSALADTDYHNVSEVIKMGSFSRIASFIPRRVLRSYAKVACSKCPDLIRDFYSALKLSQARSCVKTAAAADTAKLTFNKDDNVPIKSIVTPVFLSEAEAKELDSDGTETKLIKICEDCFVLPEANNKINMTSMPTAEEVARSMGQDFEYLSPGEWAKLAEQEMHSKPFEPFVSVCPSSMRDYWVAPRIDPDEDSDNWRFRCDDDYVSAMDNEQARKMYDLSRNNLGGEYATFEKANRKPFNAYDCETFDRAMVFYFPKRTEKRMYLADILSHPLSLSHNLNEILTGARSSGLPIATGTGKYALVSLTAGRAYNLRENPNSRSVSSGKNGTTVINYKVGNDVVVKVVADAKSGYVKTITYRGDYAPEGMSDCDDDQTKYVTLEFNGKIKTFNPYEFTCEPTNYNGYLTLKALAEGRRDIVIAPYGPRSSSSTFTGFTRVMFDARYLNKDFVLNGLGRKANLTIGLPCTVIQVGRNGKTVINLPKPEKSEGPKMIKYMYKDPEQAVNAIAHLGVEPEDLAKVYSDIKQEADHLSAINSNGMGSLSYALTAAEPGAEQQGLDTDSILQQAAVLLSNIQQTQEQMKYDQELRDRALETHMQLVDEKLQNIDQLQEVLERAIGAAAEEEVPAEAAPVEEPAAEESEGAMPPEVIETLVSAALDPSTAEANDMGPEEVQILQSAAQGDEEAAAQAGLTGKDYALFLQLYHENADQNNYADQAEPAEGGEAAQPQVKQEDLQQLAEILSDPKAAKRDMDPEMVDNLLRAVLGDESAAAAIGITVDIAKQADELADQLAEARVKEEEAKAKEDNINTLAQLLIDPEAAKKDVGEDMINSLMAAVQGDEAAAAQINITVADAQAAAFRAQQQMPAEAPAEAVPAPEATPAQETAPAESQMQESASAEESGQPSVSDEDIDTLAQIILNEDEARKQMGDDMVDALGKAVEGDEAAAAKIGITVADAKAAAQKAVELSEGGKQQQTSETEDQTPEGQAAEDQSAGSTLTEEDEQAIADILADPEAAKQNYDPAVVDQILAAADGDEEAAKQLNTTVEEIQAIAQNVQPAQGGGEEQQAPQTPQEAEQMLRDNFDHARQLVEAYLDPTKVEEYDISADELGTVTLVLRSPDIAMRSGVPGEQVQAISDAYKMITGKSVYQSAELEFDGGASGSLPVPAPQLSSLQTAIPVNKAFEEYAKPLTQTSALLDLLPKVKTAKLFFKNADAFRDMLTTLGEILINLQLNAVHYKESLGGESFKKLLTRVRKMYEDFGTTVLEMYSLDKD